MWGAVSDERTDLPFTIASGLRQRIGIHGHILLTQVQDWRNLEGYVLVFISLRNNVAPVTGFSFHRPPTSRRLSYLKFKHPVPTSQETHHVSATKPNRLMLFRDIIAVYLENHTEQTKTLFGQKAGFMSVKAGGVHSYRYTFEGLMPFFLREVDGLCIDRINNCVT
jgi:hypothetical protein